MKYLVVIPARGGSKRVPGKNIRLLGGKPLIEWSIDVAKKVFKPNEILVSTDDDEIATIAKKRNVLVPWLRPPDLSLDESKSAEVVIHAVNWYEDKFGLIDGVILLQPTSPFRTEATLRSAIKLYENNDRKSIVTVSPSNLNPKWNFTIEKDRLVPSMLLDDFNLQIHDSTSLFSLNGLIYIISPSEIRLTNNFIGPNTVPLIVNSEREAIDIDTEFEFKVASFLCNEI